MRRDVPARPHPNFAIIIRGKVAWHNPDNRERCAIQHNVASDNIRLSSESALPQIVANDSDVIVTWTGVLFTKRPAENRADPKKIKKIGGNGGGVNSLRLIASAQGKLIPAAGSQDREHG